MTSTLHQMWTLNNKHNPKKSFQNEAQKGILQIAVLIFLQPGPPFLPATSAGFQVQRNSRVRREWEQAHMQHWLEKM